MGLVSVQSYCGSPQSWLTAVCCLLKSSDVWCACVCVCARGCEQGSEMNQTLIQYIRDA